MNELHWPSVALLMGIVAAKMMRHHEDPEHAARMGAVKDVFCVLHAAAGHNGCAERCWWAAIDSAHHHLGSEAYAQVVQSKEGNRQ